MEKIIVAYPASYKKYLDYINSEEDFEFRVRMEFEWDDTAYQQFMKLLMDVIADYRETDLIPQPVMYFFISGITHLVGTISNPDFLNDRTRQGPALKDYQDLVNSRKEELLDMQKKFFSGELLMKQS